MLSAILIVDKRKEMSIKYKRSLSNPEIQVFVSHTLNEAVKLIQEMEPDMIILSDSFGESISEFCKNIRALTYNTRPTIVALSKSADLNDKINILECGADDFISEPVNIDEFKTRIMAHLRRDIESNLDTTTLLPNIKFVKKSLKRLQYSETQSALLVELQNLEEYKKYYTDLAGDKLAQTLTAIAKSAIEENDFIGQINDKTFLIITNKYRLERLAAYLVFAFDTVVPKFYSKTDNERGYMLMKGTSQAGMRVNFVSILVGGLFPEYIKTLKTPNSILNKLFEIKNIARIPSGSNYAIERTRLTAKNSIAEVEKNNSIYVRERDDSLQYLIRTALELHGYNVISDLDENSAPAIVIMDSGDRLEELEFLKKLRSDKNFVNTKFIVTTSVRDKSAILNSGADLYLPKPYEIMELIKWVEYFVRI